MKRVTRVVTFPDPLERAFRQHQPSLVRLAVLLTGSRAVADDLVQEAFLRIQRAKPWPPANAEYAYLRRTLVNLSHSRHRRLLVRQRHDEPTFQRDHHSAEVEASSRLAAQRVGAAVRGLPTRQRECVVLHYFEDLTDTQIAEALGVSAGSVKTHLHRARLALAASLEDLR